MCAIVGIFNLCGQQIDARVLANMRDSMSHRGPDDVGTYVQGRVGLGFRRLSVIDLPGGKQPFIHRETGVCLVFNGEIYNFRELRAQLTDEGHVFRTDSDAEVLLASYMEWGILTATHLVGMFAFAVWDPRTETLLLVRDRLGIKPLFWTIIGDCLCFASEVKSFFFHPGFVPVANNVAISAYFTLRHAPGRLSYYQGVNKVLPGSQVSISARQVSTSTYWKLLPPSPVHGIGLAEATEKVERLLQKAIDRCRIADVRVGAFLSGGVDSGLMVSMLARMEKETVSTFSAGYREEGYDESSLAFESSTASKTRHIALTIDRKRFEEDWFALAARRDGPLSIPHEVPLRALFQEVRRHVKVVLSGEGADELFGGYGRVLRSAYDWKRSVALHRLLGAKFSSGLAGRFPDSWLSSLHFVSAGNQASHFLSTYQWFSPREKADLLTPDFLASTDDDQEISELIEQTFEDAADSSPYDRVLHAFQKIHLGCLLEKLDYIGMDASVEGRVPFVDHELVEYVNRLPYQYKITWNSPLARMRGLIASGASASENFDTTKYILRKVAAKWLPPSVACRRKLGFPTPLDTWLNHGDLNVVREVLQDRTTAERGIFRKDGILTLLANRTSDSHDARGKKLWMLTSLELWLRHGLTQRSLN
jgi:asparagine synthase (glutamine-hydrolysing)